MSMSSVITLAQLERAMMYVKAYHDGTGSPIPLTPTSGTVVIDGNLDVDLIVNGNIEVSGTISGNVTASGTITYGELTGTIQENANIYKCDISIDGGTFTFYNDVSYDENGALYVNGRAANNNETTISIYSDLTIITSSWNYALYNNGGTLVIASGATLNVTATYSSAARGLYNENGTLIVRGTVNASGKATGTTATSHGIYSTGSNATFTVESGGIVNATAAENNQGRGIEITGKFTVYGTVYATGSTTNSNSQAYGIYNNGGTFTVYGIVDAVATNQGASSSTTANGLYQTNSAGFTIERDGIVSLVAEGPTSTSYGIYSGNTTIYGVLYTTAPSDNNCVYGGTVTVEDGGSLYKNGVLQE